MAIPLLGYPLSSQNGRVSNLAGDDNTVRSQPYPQGLVMIGAVPQWMR